MTRRRHAVIAATVLFAATSVTAAAPVSATDARLPEPTIATGLGFDTCTAPSVAALDAWWGTSPYTTVNIYFGGINRGCRQPNLTPSWVQTVSGMGWGLLPTYMGHQPICILGTKEHRFTEADATAIGTANAQDAIAQAQHLGLLPGSALYADVEHYDRRDTSCITAVRRYVSAWTTTLHDAGYLAGVYVHQDSGVRDLSAVYDSPDYARPDAVWMARWDGNPALTGWPTAPDSQWSNHQRAKQYLGDHNETHGGVTINIDSDSLDAPIATVADR
ncbi:glycoside hydrolase domain-containing protein [Jiangella alkaliphila]|uniref:Rv2525c-like glycoside hydrolase-like domain-containing protein n=1 Tax=Jiangella alkaliphila TaxID=419479 RepID=A0A1H2HYW1_9ACTN|nr:glycoside hydrolase domain-containing protein [Jiangella alkaliphila]SDU36984.1 protein of unknown function [Jiangella alkaliphila]